VVRELDVLRRHVAVFEPARDYEAPLLGELLRTAVEGSHLEVVYDSASGTSKRVIYPYGVLASQGFWYCACPDHKRGKIVSLRANRFRSIQPTEGLERPAFVALEAWTSDDESTSKLRLRAYVTEHGAKSFELTSLFGKIETGKGCRSAVETEIPRASIDFCAGRLLSVGTDVKVESPRAHRSHAREG
jgi:predicted DNA-binding transcriptional regulator YafY